jgi:OmpA-OmpF porin, OOP family
MRHPMMAAIVAGVCLWGPLAADAQDWHGILGDIADRAAHKAADKAMDKATESAQPSGSSTSNSSNNSNGANGGGGASGPAGASASQPGASGAASTGQGGTQGSFKSYQNYDFVPGDKIVFDDDFRADTDGEFPGHWKLLKGQGVINIMQGAPVFALTEGNYVEVEPRVRTSSYLSDSFTVEFDFYPKSGGYEQLIAFLVAGDNEEQLVFGKSVGSAYFEHDFSANYPGNTDAFLDNWHHAALVYKNGQIKCYLDQYRVLVIPDAGKLKPESVKFGGIGSQDSPLLFKNVRIANGGGMTLIEKFAKDGRAVTHGILFDVGKASVRPESMGTIRQIMAALNADGSLKLEIDGHTDSDGDAAKNLALSSARADAVRKVLVDQGVDGSRLIAKGFGASKPIDSNSTAEGKANNRRVELVKV